MGEAGRSVLSVPINRAGDELAVYIHWPYCARICPYCDFNIYKARPDDGLVKAICTDLAHWRNWGGPRRVSSIHFGGGTPSLLPPEDIAQIVSQIRALWDVTQSCEIALEANPVNTDERRWAENLQAGINRVSLGVQCFDDAGLKFLGRDHSAAEAKAALRCAADIFPNVSADLIYGWHGQNKAGLMRDLDVLRHSGIGHISAYQLTVEAGTAFDRAERRGDMKAVEADISAGFYDLVRGELMAAGFVHYEVSNFAKSDQSSQHNLAYWQGRDYVGVGPGAHGRMTIGGARHATISAMHPDNYQSRIAAHGHGIDSQAQLSPQSWGEEYVLMGLRIEAGISLSYFTEITGRPLPPDNMDLLIGDGLLHRQDDRLMATARGRLLLNKVTELLLI